MRRPAAASTVEGDLAARAGDPAVTDDGGRAAAKAPPARLWWIMLARAAIALLLGLVVLLSEKTRPALVNFIGVYWLVGSLLTLRWVFRHQRQPGSRLVWAAAVIGVVAGLLVLLRFALEDVLSTDLVLTLVGLTAILTGLLRVSGTFRDHVIDGRPRLPHRVTLGILELMLGVCWSWRAMPPGRWRSRPACGPSSAAPSCSSTPWPCGGWAARAAGGS
jgi:uncharacterized membrane protein HdeD (DUF308 family)